MATQKKTLLVGLDAACWAYLNPLLEAKKLPALQKLMNAGSSGTLYSTMPALTPTAWSSISTGKNPGKHGIFDMTYRQQGSYEFLPIHNGRRVGTPFWKRLNEQGVKVGLVNVPFTYPPEEIDGFTVCGFGAPNTDDVIFPQEANEFVKNKFGEYQPTVDPIILQSRDYEAIMQAEVNLQTQHIQIALTLAEQFEVEVLVINLMVLDHVNHLLPDQSHIEAAIIQLDQDLETLTEGFQPDNTLVISDHGSRRVKGDFLLHKWLRDQGYTYQKSRTDLEKKAALNWMLNQWLTDGNGIRQTSLSEKVKRYFLFFVLRNLPKSITGPIWDRLEQRFPSIHDYLAWSEKIDYGRSKVLFGGSYSGVIYLNLQGREPQGVVSSDQKDVLLNELVDQLMLLSDPDTGEPLFPEVSKPEDIYTGEVPSYAPDLIINTYCSPWNILSTFTRGAVSEKLKDNYFAENIVDFGHHSYDGVFVFSGIDFQEGVEAVEGNVMDAPATLLHLHDVPVPDDYDGRSLIQLMTSDFLDEYPLQTQHSEDDKLEPQAFSQDSSVESDDIKNHLRALGYID